MILRPRTGPGPEPSGRPTATDRDFEFRRTLRDVLGKGFHRPGSPEDGSDPVRIRGPRQSSPRRAFRGPILGQPRVQGLLGF
ncbi:MAG: hypothetical protein MZU97_18835 [Bacillus subtilis]|nr:hypothetical protein [Bacillus subtilis]